MWRVGRKLGRTLYVDDVCVGMVDTPELAARIVAAMNDNRTRARRGHHPPCPAMFDQDAICACGQ